MARKNFGTIIVATSAALGAGGACFFDLPDVREPAREGGADTSDAAGGDVASDGTEPACGSFFCDDFDHGEPLASRWTALATGEGASVGIATNAGLSPPASLVASTPRMDVSAQSVAYVRSKDPLPVYAEAHLAYALYFEDATRADGHALTSLVAIGSVWFAAILVRPDGAMELVERTRGEDGGVAFSVRARFGPLARDRWTRFAVSVRPPGDGGAPPGSITVRVDGDVVVAAAPITSPLATSGERRFALGLPSVQGPTGAWTVRVDDVVLELK